MESAQKDPLVDYASWNRLDVNENANRYQGPSSFFAWLLDKYMERDAYEILPPHLVKAHASGDIYIHKLPHSVFIPYCTGHSLARLLEKGLRTVTIISRPARHFDTFVDHIANFLITMQHYFTGAQALSKVEWYAGPFLRNDKLNYKQIKQQIQRLLYNLNYPTRIGLQTPFTNFTITMDAARKALDGDKAIYGGVEVGALGEYEEEAKTFLKALIELYSEGDSVGQPFSVAGDEVTMICLNGRVIVDYVSKIIDPLFEKYKERIIMIENREILPLVDLGVDLEILGITPEKVPTWQKVLFLSRHRESEIVEIKAELGFSVKVTKSHSILVWDKGNIVAKQAGEVRPGEDELVILRALPLSESEHTYLNVTDLLKRTEIADRVYVVRKGNKPTKLTEFDVSKITPEDRLYLYGSRYTIPAIVKLSKELGYLISIILADGYFSKDYNKKRGGYELSIGFNLKNEKELANKVASLIERIFEVPVCKRERKEVNLVELRVGCGLLAILFRELVWSESGRKVPEILLSAPTEVKIGVLAGLIDGDGYVRIGEAGGNWARAAIVLYTTDKKLAYSIAYLLTSMGISFGITRVDNARKLTEKPYYHIRIPVSQIPEECVELSWKLQRRRELVLKRIRTAREITTRKPYLVAPIRLDGGGYVARLKVKEVKTLSYDGYVYDFTTTSETFLVNMVFVHNTFPIPTLMVTAKWIWEDPEIHEAVFKTASKKGSFYWLNTRIVDPDAAYAMCCRLVSQKTELVYVARNSKFTLATLKRDVEALSEEYWKTVERQRFGGLWALPDITGSVNVVDVNLPRIALESKSEESRFWELYDDKLKLVKEAVDWFRNRYIYILKNYPNFYAMIMEYMPEFPSSHFNTIGLIGLPEATAILMGEPRLWLDGSRRDWLRAAELMRRIVEYTTKTARKWMLEEGVPWNVEEVPGESASPKLAMLDLKRYSELREFMPDPENPVYATSIVPYYANMELPDRIEVEQRVQRYFTGGVMMHIFLGEEPEPEALADLAKKLTQTELIYWSYTPAVTHCNTCEKTFTGLYTKCPSCGSENIDVWSRIIGYYRPLRNWNPQRRKEFWTRKHYVF